MFAYSFMIRAFIIGTSIAITMSLLSPFIVLRRQALIADGISHSSFLGFVIGILLSNSPLWIAIIISIITSLIINYLINNTGFNSDSAIGIISSISIAIALIIISAAKGFNRSVEELMKGSINTNNQTDLIFSVFLLVIVIIYVLVFYRDLYLITFDDTPIKINKTKYNFLNYSLSALIAVMIVIGIQQIGALLVSSLIIFPTLIANQYKLSFKYSLILGIISGIISTTLGIISSFYINIPAGAAIVCINAILLIVSIIIRKIRRV